MTDAGLTGQVADAAAGTSDTGSAFSFDQSGGAQPDNSQQQTPDNSGGNPAWKEVLDALPSSLHPTITPHLQKWDQGVQQRFTQQAQQLEPWKGIIDSGTSPEAIQGMLWLFENDPERLWKELGTLHGFNSQGQPVDDPNALDIDQIQDPEGQAQQFDITQVPEFQQLKMANEQLQQMVSGQMQQTVQQQAAQELETEINTVRQANFASVDDKVYKESIEPMVLSLAHTFGITVTEAAKKFTELQGPLQGRTPAPQVLSPSGGVPLTGQVKPSELSRDQKRQLAVEMLKQAHEANQ